MSASVRNSSIPPRRQRALAPGVQDPFNTLPAWGYPYISSALGFSGAETATQINGGLEQRVLGLSGYAFLDNSWYAELGTYRSLSRAMQTRLGQQDVNADPSSDPGRLDGSTAYWRLAWFKDMKNRAWSMGLFGFNSGLHPDRAPDAPRNRYSDLGVDAQYQFLGTREHAVTLQGSYVRERQQRDALVATGEAVQRSGHLNEFKLNASYNFRQTWGLSVGHFRTSGDADAALYAANAGNVPDTAGNVIQLDWTPFGKEDSWGAPWANLRLGTQYTMYAKYNGASKNYDGLGRNASDNNTLYLFAWTSF